MEVIGNQAARHRQLMAEMEALEARERGEESAQVVSPPRDKLSIGKGLMFLGGLGAVVYLFAFSDKSPLSTLFGEESEDEGKPKAKGEKTVASKIIEEAWSEDGLASKPKTQKYDGKIEQILSGDKK